MTRKSWKLLIAIVLTVALVAAPVLADDSISELAKRITSIVNLIQSNYYRDVKAEDLVNGALKGMFQVLDKHSTYFTPEEYTSFSTSLSGEFSGIGVYIEKKDGYITVISPIEGSPAFKAGLKAGDRIITVDDKDIKGYETDQAASLIKGPTGSKVRLGILREGAANTLNFELVRETIKINPVKYEIKDENIGFVRITQFNGNVYSEMQKAVTSFKEKKVKGVIIDLRGNPGGLLNEVIEIARILVPKGPVVHIEYKGSQRETYRSNLTAAPFKIVVLIDEGSASASEILAGAIKESGTGKLVGTKTYGKGTVQTVMGLPGNAGAKITIANYLTPSGFSLDGKGIHPDIEVKAMNVVEAEREYAPIKGNRSLKLKLIGLDVYGMQQRLNKLGYKVPEDGIYEASTRNAVLKFQKDNKLKQDGTFDGDDLKILNAKFDQYLSAQDPQMDRAISEIKKMVK